MRLRDRVNGLRARTAASITRRLLSGEDISREEIVGHIAFAAGAEWILAHPEQAEKNLELVARKAFEQAQADLQIAQEELTPYA